MTDEELAAFTEAKRQMVAELYAQLPEAEQRRIVAEFKASVERAKAHGKTYRPPGDIVPRDAAHHGDPEALITRNLTILARFRHMQVSAGVLHWDEASDARLYALVKGETLEERLHAMDVVTRLASEDYWREQGL